MAIENGNRIITLEGLNTFRLKNALDHFAKEEKDDAKKYIVIKGCDETTGRLESDAIKIGSKIQLLVDTSVTGTLDATTLKQNGSAVALASQIPSDLNTKLAAITYSEAPGGYTIGVSDKALYLVGTGVYINGNNLEYSFATDDDINSIFS